MEYCFPAEHSPTGIFFLFFLSARRVSQAWLAGLSPAVRDLYSFSVKYDPSGECSSIGNRSPRWSEMLRTCPVFFMGILMGRYLHIVPPPLCLTPKNFDPFHRCDVFPNFRPRRFLFRPSESSCGHAEVGSRGFLFFYSSLMGVAVPVLPAVAQAFYFFVMVCFASLGR